MDPALLLTATALAVPVSTGGGEPPPPTETRTATSALLSYLFSGPIEGETRTEDRFEAAPLPWSSEPTVDVGGALRFNVRGDTWTGRSQAPNLTGFDVFRLNVAARYEGLSLSAEYRFYAGYTMLKHGFVGYEPVKDVLSLQIGVCQVPFGILPYASHSYFFDLGYYVGLEDDYDLGVRADLEVAGLDVKVGVFKNDEGHYTGRSLDSARYSYDLVRVAQDTLTAAGIPEARNLEELNQTNLRVALPIEHAEGYRTEVGISGQLGQTFDGTSERYGTQWAGAGHVDGDYGWFDVQLQAGVYDVGVVSPDATDRGLVVMGAYDAPYAVAAEAAFVMANAALEIPVQWGPISSVTVYEDYSTIQKLADGYAASHQSTTGALFVAGPLYTYLDVAVGKNHPWLGTDYVGALGRGDRDAPWQARVNANLGWYF